MTHLARDNGLARMKRIALGLLVLAAIGYVAASHLEPHHPAFAYVAAFAEAAMIGAVADWFAVVALFRHPLGLPIPHTAIIPSNKDRIGENLARFICENFLSDTQVLDKLREFDAAGRLAAWLTEPAHAAQVGEHLAATARYGLSAFDDERVRNFIRSSALAGLEKIDVAPLAGQLLDALTDNRRHQELLDEVLKQVAKGLEDEQLQAKVVGVIAAEAKLLRLFGLDLVAAKYAAAKIVAGISRTIGEMSEDASHPLRVRFDEFVAGFIERLKHDPQFRERGQSIRDELLAHPALTGYLQGLWSELLAWLHADLGRDDSSIRARVAATARTLGDKLAVDAPMREWINAQVLAAAPRWIDRYRAQIRRYIVARVQEWNTQQLTDELERNIGRDLQFVRINGTLVGGLVGLLIYAGTQLMRAA